MSARGFRFGKANIKLEVGSDVRIGQRRPKLFIGLGGYGGQIVDRVAARTALKPLTDGSYHFLCFDTEDAAFGRLRNISPQQRILLHTPFATKKQYVKEKLGLDASRDGEEAFKRLVPTGYVDDVLAGRAPRDTFTGAGQIRLESRIEFYLDMTVVGSVSKTIEALKAISTRVSDAKDNHFIDAAAPLEIYVVTSLAGGTGSGLLVPLVGLLRTMFSGCMIHGILLLPQVCSVDPALRSRAFANAYAALQEIEYVQRLGRQSQADDTNQALLKTMMPEGGIPVAVNPKDQIFAITERPLDIVFLVGNAEMAGKDKQAICDLVSDFCWIQLEGGFSDIANASRCNFGFHVGKLDVGFYPPCYSTFATALMLVPQQDISMYALLRWGAEALRRAHSADRLADDPAAAALAATDPFFDPADTAFARGLRDQAERDRKAREEAKNPTRTEIEEIVALEREGVGFLDPFVEKIKNGLVVLGEGINESETTLRNWLAGSLSERDFLSGRKGLVTGKIDEKVEELDLACANAEDKVSRLCKTLATALEDHLHKQKIHGAQRRYFLLCVKEALRDTYATARSAGSGPNLLDEARFRSTLEEAETDLRAKAPHTPPEKMREFGQKALGKNPIPNENFVKAKASYVDAFLKEIRAEQERRIRGLERTVLEDLLNGINARLSIYRFGAKEATFVADELDKKAKYLLKTGKYPGGEDGQCNIFTRDREVPLGAAARAEGDRLWEDVVSALFLEKGAPHAIRTLDVQLAVMAALDQLVRTSAEPSTDEVRAALLQAVLERAGQMVSAVLLSRQEAVRDEYGRPVMTEDGTVETTLYPGLRVSEALDFEFRVRAAAGVLAGHAMDPEGYYRFVFKDQLLKDRLATSAKTSPAAGVPLRQSVAIGAALPFLGSELCQQVLQSLPDVPEAVPAAIGGTLEVNPRDMSWSSPSVIAAVALREVMSLLCFDDVRLLHEMWTKHMATNTKDFLYADAAFENRLPPLPLPDLLAWAKMRYVTGDSTVGDSLRQVFVALWKGWLTIDETKRPAILTLKWNKRTKKVNGLLDWKVTLDGLGALLKPFLADLDAARDDEIDVDKKKAADYLAKVPRVLREWIALVQDYREHLESRRDVKPETLAFFKNEEVFVGDLLQRFEEEQKALTHAHKL